MRHDQELSDLGVLRRAGFPGDDEKPHSGYPHHYPAAGRGDGELETVPHPDRQFDQPGEPEVRGGSPGDPERDGQVDQRVVLQNMIRKKCI